MLYAEAPQVRTISLLGQNELEQCQSLTEFLQYREQGVHTSLS